MATGMENLDPESRTILERAMSMESAATAMGLDPVRRREQQQLAEDMERKNSEARRRRAAAIMGEQKVPDAAPKQAPVKRRKGFAQQPSTVRQEMPVITPVQPLPPDPAETQEQGVDNTAMRNVFAKLSGKPISRPATLAPVAEPVVEDPANEAVEEAPAPAETPEVHVVHEQELVVALPQPVAQLDDAVVVQIPATALDERDAQVEAAVGAKHLQANLIDAAVVEDVLVVHAVDNRNPELSVDHEHGVDHDVGAERNLVPRARGVLVAAVRLVLEAEYHLADEAVLHE